ncbi:unnamed protein product [Schistosoma mattheei]|uniref:Uncharacterized protein n=1 Tax=Schistosoma mattheei TaxID=31246 RepID=A0A183NQW0_9TREM|nr:unnamed protein product [Schistosoma mattheei]
MYLLLELELAQTERVIELGRLRQKRRNHYTEVVADKVMLHVSTCALRTFDVNPGKDWITMISKALVLPIREIIRLDGNPINYWRVKSTSTIETMVLKLPTHIQQEWLKSAYEIIRGGREPLFADLIEFVKEQ